MSTEYQDYLNANFGPEDIPTGPLEIVECEACAGRGYHQRRITVYEQGCGFSHDDTDEIPCAACGGSGEFICEAEGRS